MSTNQLIKAGALKSPEEIALGLACEDIRTNYSGKPPSVKELKQAYLNLAKAKLVEQQIAEPEMTRAFKALNLACGFIENLVKDRPQLFPEWFRSLDGEGIIKFFMEKADAYDKLGKGARK